MNILEQFLTSFEGCLLVVSHDRYFIDKVCDTLFILEDDGAVSGFVGKCSEFIEYTTEQKKEATLKESKEKALEREKQKEQESIQTKEQNSSKQKKLSFKEQKEFEQLEIDIEKLEERKTELETLMSGTDYEKIAEYTKEYQDVSNSLEEKYLRWEELA
jgi:ATP-binding cassette subfamily F protein uup